MKSSKTHPALPIGRTARIAFEIDAMRASCCKAAQIISNKSPIDEHELEECARLDEALQLAHNLLKTTVRNVMLSRLSRRSKASETGGV